MKFPKRKHTGCDPICGECRDWLREVAEQSKPATREAFKTFLNTIAAIIPELSSVEFEDFRDVYELLEASVGQHVAECLPQPEAVRSTLWVSNITLEITGRRNTRRS